MEKLSKIAQEGKINENASITDKQSIIVNAPIDQAWSLISDISSWSDWYSEIKNVKVGEVKVGGEFTWQMRSNQISSVIQKIEAPNTLAFVSKSRWLKAIHLWKLEAVEKDQTIVSIEESLQGFLTTFFVGHQRLHSNLLNWLSSLKQAAESK